MKVAPSGTGAAPVAVSGPVTAAYERPRCCQNTSPQVTVATDVISATCSLVQVHTSLTHGESDPRVSNRSRIVEAYGKPILTVRASAAPPSRALTTPAVRLGRGLPRGLITLMFPNG
ncbi:hypothetical protein Abr02nite_36720 [Paractinoplanes brasiliensis]|nr:hypothetical protein Abr02nite_36720 [Actinoplanes brasiliensis]